MVPYSQTIYVDKEIMSERHLGVKLIGKVDVVEEILSQMIRQRRRQPAAGKRRSFSDEARDD